MRVRPDDLAVLVTFALPLGCGAGALFDLALGLGGRDMVTDWLRDGGGHRPWLKFAFVLATSVAAAAWVACVNYHVWLGGRE